MQLSNGENFSWRLLAVESVVIMLSVLLGFMLNGWRQSASEQEMVDAALQSIATETRQNKRLLDGQLPYFQDMAGTLDSLVHVSGEGQTVNPLEREVDSVGIPGWGGLQLNDLSTFAYQSAASAGVLSHMDYDLANRISSILMLQASYNDVQDKFIEASLNDNLDSFNKLAITFGIRARVAGRLVDEYDTLLDALAEEHGVSAGPRAADDSSRAAR